MTCVVQARMGSSRFPGKVLADLGGRPLLAFLLRRLAGLDVDHLVVATSDAGGDDPVAALVEDSGIEVVRGPETDVLGRFALALDRFPAGRVIRITGDCPLADPAIVRAALAVADESGADYVSNTLIRTFPDGLDVEVMSVAALQEAAANATDAAEREHVTPYIYRRPGHFALRALRRRPNLNHLRWTVDTRDDLQRVRGVVERLGGIDAPWEDAAALEPAEPAHPDGLSLLPAEADDAATVLALRNDPDAVRWSRTGRAVGGDEHRAWFGARLDDPATRLWVARRDEKPVGSVRVDVDDGVGVVSIAVAATDREQGVGTQVLRQLIAALDADHQVHTLDAFVHAGNQRSKRLFARAGFGPAGREGDFLRVSWTRPAPG